MTRRVRLRAALVGATIVAAGLLLRGPLAIGGVPKLPDGKPIRVEVRNGSGVTGAALGLAEALRDEGFDVVDIRNADRPDYPRTLVIDRVGEPDWAGAVAAKMGVQETVDEPDGDLLLEVTVILGRDLAAKYGGDK